MDGAVERSANLSAGKDLQEGAGQIAPLSAKENFESGPHPIRALIALLEKATEPSRELDAAIQRVVGDGPWHIGCGGLTNAFTSLVDAALSLVPRHHLWELRQGFEARAIVWMIETDYDDHEVPTGYSTTYPALALCIAALKARAEHDRIPS